MGEVVAIVPARGGSKGIPGKNLVEVAGVSLVERSIRAAQAAESIDRVVVSTDDAAIAQRAERAGAEVIDRPDELSGDQASSESALLHVLDRLDESAVDVDVVVFVQCTSPFIEAASIDRAVGRVRSGADCVFAAVESWDFVWRNEPDGSVAGVNHDASFRPRRQDREQEWLETGAFYVMNAAGFRRAEHRFFGRVEVEPVDRRHAVEIDTFDDLQVARAMAVHESGLPPLAGVAALVTDFDGVHTADTAYVDQDGVETVRVNRRDGHGVALLRRAGVPALILSTERNPVVAARAEKLGVECLHGIDEKGPALATWASDRGVDLADLVYVGNDVNDLGCLELAGHPVAVSDAHPDVVAAARYVTRAAGGGGAVREVAEAILAGRC
ncbi:MAG: acylneuraminate cytidylyltransferase [Actinomycetota bacterium]